MRLSDAAYIKLIRKDDAFIDYDQDSIMSIAFSQLILGSRGFIVKVLDTPKRL